MDVSNFRARVASVQKYHGMPHIVSKLQKFVQKEGTNIDEIFTVDLTSCI